MAGEKVIVCRCEEITEEEIRQIIREGAHTIDEIKRVTRAGKGLCQGKTCALTVLRILAEETGQKIDDLKQPSYRPPVRPLPLAVVGEGVDPKDEKIAT
ncbi:MAG: (2Fe-2S)-binding protein [Clostridia bacterium]|nr:(2Fe-2S)-binding protein [Clostridia bacterium]